MKLTLFILLCLLLPQHVSARQTIRWTNATGGDFLDASNWTSDVPSASDTVEFNLDATYDVTLNTDHTVQAWNQWEGEVTHSGGATLTTNSRINVSRATLNLTGEGTTFQTASDFVLGLTDDAASLNIGDGASVISERFVRVLSNSAAKVSGTGSAWTHAGELQIEGGNFQIDSGGQLSNEGNGRIFSGAVTVTGGGSRWHSNGAFLRVGEFDNSGSLTISDGGFVSGKEVRLGLGGGSGTVLVTGNESMLSAEALSVGLQNDRGEIRIENGAQLVSGATSVQAKSDADSKSEVVITGAGSQWNLVGSDSRLTIGLLADSSGIAEVNGVVEIADGGNINTDSTTRILEAGTLKIDNASFNSTGDTTIEGNLVLTGVAMVDSNLQMMTTGLIEVSSNASATIDGNLQHNGDSISVGQNGRLFVQGTASGSGDYLGDGEVVFESVVAPGNSPAVINFEGDLTLASTSELQIEIGGLAVGEFDMLNVLGDADLQGNLSVSLIGGFELANDQQFSIINVDSQRSGLFSNFSEGDLVGNFGGQNLFITYNGGDGNDVSLFTIASVPEPGSTAILLLATLPAMRRRKRNCASTSKLF